MDIKSMFMALTSTGILPTACGSIGVEEDLLFSAHLANFGDRLNDTDLVVDGHDADKSSIGSDRSLRAPSGRQDHCYSLPSR